MVDPAADPMPISRFDYDLPPDRIAQHPLEPRDSSKLLLVNRRTGTLSDHVFRDLPALLRPGDLLVVNDTRVLPARIHTVRQTGAMVEFLLLEPIGGGRWKALARPARRVRPGELLAVLDTNLQPTSTSIEVVGRDNAVVIIAVPDLDEVLALGEMPLPPYIHEALDDAERYQTVYSRSIGSAAAPTAGLHFTPELLDACRSQGIEIATATLHVGLDTFQPVKHEDARKHQIHAESYSVNGRTMQQIRSTRARGGRVVAVGTTSVRTLESVADAIVSSADVPELSGATSLYIMPGYQFGVVDAMITNFHLPRTTLLLLVSALAGEELIRAAYQHAINNDYRFYSFGDAMLIV